MLTIAQQFLRAWKMHPDCVDAETTARAFLSAMESGLEEEDGQLPMIPTYLGPISSLPADEPVAVLDAGGTNLRVAKVVFDEHGEGEILSLKKGKMPGTEGTITAEEMFQTFARELIPMISENGRVAVCFSYAVQCTPDFDGVIKDNMSKEVKVEGAKGRYVGREIVRAIREQGYMGPLSLVLLNDTVAVLYSALRPGDEGNIGFILGTGVNAAYFEQTSQIEKLEEWPEQPMAINIEAAEFIEDPTGPIDEELDEDSRNPGEHLHEKHVSGAYLGELMQRTLLKLAKEEVITPEMEDELERMGPLSLADVEAFLEDGSALTELAKNSDDLAILEEVVLAVEQRAGKLIAAMLSGMMQRIRKTGYQGRIKIAENGTTFYRARPLREMCMACLEESGLGPYEFVRVEEDTLLGSAVAAFQK